MQQLLLLAALHARRCTNVERLLPMAMYGSKVCGGCFVSKIWPASLLTYNDTRKGVFAKNGPERDVGAAREDR